MKKLLLYFVAYLVVLPTILVAAPLSFVGLLAACDDISHPGAGSALALFSSIIFGDLGVASMWILFIHYRRNVAEPVRAKWHYFALLSGAAVSLTLVLTFDGGLFATLFFGWPLLGAVFFFGLLTASRSATS
jgi:hypothetical protein